MATVDTNEQINPDELPLSAADEAELNAAAAEEAAALASQNNPDAKAQSLPTCAAMREMLSRPIPPRLLKKMRNYGGGGEITYIHWLTAKKFMDLRSPGWQYFVRGIVVTEIGVAVHTEVRVPCSDGVIVGSGVGFEPHRQGKDNKPTGFGGAPVVAERQSFKRSCAMLGLGANLYDK